MKNINIYLKFGSLKIPKVQKFLDPTIFKRGCCEEKKQFAKVSSVRQKLSYLLRYLELALKFQMSDRETNLSNICK